MNQNIKGQVKATQKTAFRVTAIIMAIVVLCAGTAFAATSEASAYIVEIYEGSQVTKIETTQTVAEKVVAEAGIQLSEDDKLILDNFNPGKDSRIVIYRASLVTFVHTNGKTLKTMFAGTVAELIESQGVALTDKIFSSVNVNAVVTNNLLVEIINAYDILINVDGEQKSVKTTARTVGELLEEQKIVLDEDDEVVICEEEADYDDGEYEDVEEVDDNIDRNDEEQFLKYHAVNIDQQSVYIKAYELEAVKARNIQIYEEDGITRARAEVIISTEDVTDAGRILGV